MTISTINAGQPAAANSPREGRGLDSLGQGDFLRLMTTQMQQQDPFDPVDQKEMLAQMAQFSSLAGIAEVNQTLKDIASRLDAVIAAQAASNPTTTADQES